MCDLPEAFRTTTRRAAKPHLCVECGCTIVKGDKYQHSSGIWDGEPHAYKQCIPCHTIMVAVVSREWKRCDDGPTFGGLRDWFVDFQYVGFTGENWLNGMAEDIGVEPDTLNKLLKI